MFEKIKLCNIKGNNLIKWLMKLRFLYNINVNCACISDFITTHSWIQMYFGVFVFYCLTADIFSARRQRWGGSTVRVFGRVTTCWHAPTATSHDIKIAVFPSWFALLRWNGLLKRFVLLFIHWRQNFKLVTPPPQKKPSNILTDFLISSFFK